MKSILKYNKINIVLLLGITLLSIIETSCKQDIEKIKAIMSTMDLPDQSGKNVEMQVTDSGKIQLVFKTPEVQRYLDGDEPYSEFPQGIEVHIYNDSGIHESTITSGYAIYDEINKIWEARDSVVVKRVKTAEQLHTEQMFWEEEEELIYSNVFTRIINETDENIGENGFEATQDFSRFKLVGYSGDMLIEDNLEEEQDEELEEEEIF